MIKILKMIDLGKLNKEIDKLFEDETPDSLTKWLLNKRFGNINILLGNGNFVNMITQKQAVFSNKNKAVFNKKDDYSGDNPITRKAA